MPGQMMRGPGTILEPGPSKVEGARAIEVRRRGLGVFPYQWWIPGPNARPQTPLGGALSPGAGSSVNLITYQVPEGYRFLLKALFMVGFCSDWVQGSGDVIWTLSVQGPAPRKVQWFQNVTIALGSNVSPYPLFAAEKFQPMDVLSLDVSVVATVAAGPPNSFAGGLSGYEYPLSEEA